MGVFRTKPLKLVEAEDAVLLPQFGQHKRGVVFWGGAGAYDRKALPIGTSSRHVRPGTRPPKKLIETATHGPDRAIFAGALSGHFGHFMVESLGALWATENLDTEIPIFYVPSAIYYGGSVGPVPARFFDLLGIGHRFEMLSEPMRVKKLYLPENGYDMMSGYRPHPQFLSWFSRLSAHIPKVQAGKVYVSRSRLNLNNQGSFLQEAAIEQGLMQEGFEIFHPQEHDLATQIATYRGAETLVVAESSAMHLIELACSTQAKQPRVVMLSRRVVPVRAMLKTLRGLNDAMQIKSLKRVWRIPGQPGWRHRSVIELDMPALWNQLERQGIISRARGMPVPTAEEVRHIRERVAPDKSEPVSAQLDKLLDLFRLNQRLNALIHRLK